MQQRVVVGMFLPQIGRRWRQLIFKCILWDKFWLMWLEGFKKYSEGTPPPCSTRMPSHLQNKMSEWIIERLLTHFLQISNFNVSDSTSDFHEVCLTARLSLEYWSLKLVHRPAIWWKSYGIHHFHAYLTYSFPECDNPNTQWEIHVRVYIQRYTQVSQSCTFRID